MALPLAIALLVQSVPHGGKSGWCYPDIGLVYCTDTQTLFLAGGDGAVVAVDLRRGQILWRAAVGKGDVTSNLVVAGAIVAFGVSNDTIRGLSRDTGQVLWSVPIKTTSMMAVGENVIASAGPDASLVAIGSAGDIVWRRQGRPGSGYLTLVASQGMWMMTSGGIVVDARAGNTVGRVPSLRTHGALAGDTWILGSDHGNLNAYAKDLTPEWSARLPLSSQARLYRLVATPDAIIALAAEHGERIYGDVQLYGLTSAGRVAWRQIVRETYTPLPGVMAATQGLAILITAVGPAKSHVRAFDLRNGTVRWTVAPEVTLSLTAGVVCAEGRCYALGTDRLGTENLVILDAGSGAATTLMPLSTPAR